MAERDILHSPAIEALRRKQNLSVEEQQRILESHVALLEATRGLIEAAQAHRTAMNPQEVLDTGWALDERIEALERLLGEE